MPNRSPWSYQQRKRLRPTDMTAPSLGFDTGELLVRKYPTGKTIAKLEASEGQEDTPNRPEMIRWDTSEEE
mgnify:CR=1 FL=1